MEKAIEVCKEYSDEIQIASDRIKVLVNKKYILDLCLRMNLMKFIMVEKRENNFMVIVSFEPV